MTNHIPYLAILDNLPVVIEAACSNQQSLVPMIGVTSERGTLPFFFSDPDE